MIIGLLAMADISAATGVKLQCFNGNTTASTNTLYVNFRLVNTGTDAIPLSNVKMRYYFTNDDAQANGFACDWATAGSSNITGTFVSITPVTGADRYLEAGFASGAGNLAVGASTEVKCRIWKTNWSNFTQTNDYSFNGTATNYTDGTNLTAYISGTLYWGTPPDGNPVTPTTPLATPTPTPIPTKTPTPVPSGTTFTPTPTPTKTATPTPTTPTPTGITPNSGLPVPPGSANVPRPAGAQGNLSVLKWAGFTGAGSYTFDDNPASQIANMSTLLGFNVRMTFYIASGWSGSSNSCWATAVSKGCELGNHSATHPQTANASDVDACTTFLQQHFGVTPLTAASPYGNASYISVVQSRFLLNRGTSGGTILPNDNTDPYNLKCNLPPQNASASTMAGYFSTARSSGGWCILLVHGFNGYSDGMYQPVDLSQFTSSVNTVKGYGDMWLDTVLNVGAYWRAQKMLSSVTPTQSGSDLIYRWTLPAHFPTGKYLRIKLTGGTPKQNGQVINWDSHGYYEIALDAGSLTVSP